MLVSAGAIADELLVSRTDALSSSSRSALKMCPRKVEPNSLSRLTRGEIEQAEVARALALARSHRNCRLTGKFASSNFGFLTGAIDNIGNYQSRCMREF